METAKQAKQQVEEILATLPADASLEDIQYHIYVRQKIEQGLADADAGRVLSHAEVERRFIARDFAELRRDSCGARARSGRLVVGIAASRSSGS
jgi:predicted transcriptional regulator